MLKAVALTGLTALALPSGAALAGADHKPQIIHAFADQADGSKPAVVTSDKDGNIYGFTSTGGPSTGNCPNGCGSIFMIAPDGTKTVLHDFANGPDDGAAPSGFVRVSDGTIFGTTVDGGRHGFGSVFRLSPGGQLTLLRSFNVTHNYSHSPHGIWPSSGLLEGRDGNFYGTTWHGGLTAPICGEGGCGTVFKITPNGEFSTIYKFKGPGDGCASYSGLSQDGAGNLYGTTQGCGSGNYGTVYKIDPVTGLETVLHIFAEGTDGNNPESAPILDAAGNLYGGTISGGSDCFQGLGCGIIYKIAPDGTETVLYRFTNQQTGMAPAGNLYLDKSGNLFGTTIWGGNFRTCNPPYGCGVVFKLAPDGTETTLHMFEGPSQNDGAESYYGLIAVRHADKQALFGTTTYGPDCCGMVFSIEK